MGAIKITKLEMEWNCDSCTMSVEGMSLKCPVCGVKGSMFKKVE